MPSPDYATTPRYSLRALKGDSLLSDIAAGFLALATDVDNGFTGYKADTHANRLAATPVDGLLWRETDTGALYIGIPGNWIPFHVSQAWQAVTLGANVETTTAGGDFQPPSARLEGDIVRLKGMIVPISGGIAVNTTIFTLGPGLRPSSIAHADVVMAGGGSSVANQLSIFTTGAVQLSSAGPAWPAGYVMTLDDKTFPLS